MYQSVADQLFNNFSLLISRDIRGKHFDFSDKVFQGFQFLSSHSPFLGKPEKNPLEILKNPKQRKIKQIKQVVFLIAFQNITNQKNTFKITLVWGSY